MVHLLACQTHALCLNPGYLTKGHHVSLGWCGFRPCAGRSTNGLFLALLFVVVAHQISSHSTLRIPVANLHLRPMTLLVNQNGRPLIGRPTTSSTGRPAGAIESATRSNGASEMEAKSIESIDLIALACRTISSEHILIDHSPSGAILIVNDNRDGHRRGRSRRERRRMLSR